MRNSQFKKMNRKEKSLFWIIRSFVVILVFLSISTVLFAQTNWMDSEMKKDSGYAPVNGLNMYYEIYQPGAHRLNSEIPLVLIHGGGSTIETTFGYILPRLTKDFMVIAVELQAHGRTSDRDAPESFEHDADDVAALLKYLKINKANFFGFSNGGTTTLQITTRHPEMVNKIIVVSANYKRDGLIDGFFEGMQNATLDNMPAPLKEGYLKVAPDKKHMQIMFEKDKERMIAFKDLSDDDLRSIKAPSLLMVGDHDVVKVEHVVKMSQLIPNARLAILPGTHGSFIGEICAAEKGSKIPEASAEIIKEFLMK